MRKNCSSVRKKIEKKVCKFEAEGREFVMFLRFTFLGLSTLENFKIALEQIIQKVKGQDNYGSRIFFNFSCHFLWKNGKKIQIEQFFQSENFSIFSSAKLARKNEIPNQSNLFWGREKIGNS